MLLLRLLVLLLVVVFSSPLLVRLLRPLLPGGKSARCCLYDLA